MKLSDGLGASFRPRLTVGLGHDSSKRYQGATVVAGMLSSTLVAGTAILAGPDWPRRPPRPKRGPQRAMRSTWRRWRRPPTRP